MCANVTCVCVAFMFACGQHHFTFIEMSSSPWGACVELRPAAMLASIDSPGLGLGWGSLSPVAPPRWPAPRQSSGGENRVSSPGHRLGALTLPVETWKCETKLCVFARAREHRNSPIKQAQVCSRKTPIRKTCHMWQVDTFLSMILHTCLKTQDYCAVQILLFLEFKVLWFFYNALIVISVYWTHLNNCS